MLGPIFGSHLQSCPSAAKSRQQACQKRRDAKQIVPLPLHSLDISSCYSSTIAFSEPSGRLGTVGLFRAQKMTPEGSHFNSGQLTCSFPCVLRFWRLYLCVPIAHNITKELMWLPHLLYFQFTSTLSWGQCSEQAPLKALALIACDVPTL